MARPEPEAAPAGAQSVRAGLVDGGGEVRQRGSQLHEDVRRQAGHHLGRGGGGDVRRRFPLLGNRFHTQTFSQIPKMICQGWIGWMASGTNVLFFFF